MQWEVQHKTIRTRQQSNKENCLQRQIRYTIMIRDSDGGPDPIRAAMEPEPPKHAPA